MEQDVLNHIEESLNKIRVLFEKASERIEALQAGEKIPATQLAEELATGPDQTGAALYPTLKFLFDGYPYVVIKRGAKGGIYKLSRIVVPIVAVALDTVSTDAHDVAVAVEDEKLQPIINS